MPVLPDLASHGIDFMSFYVHLVDGYGLVRDYWRLEGDRSSREDVAYCVYTRGGVVHTASIRWRRRDQCCDARVALDAHRPKALGFPSASVYKSAVGRFVDFLASVKPLETVGIRVRFGFGRPLVFAGSATGTRILRLAATVGVNARSAVSIELVRRRSGSVLVVEPQGRLTIPHGGMTNDFFSEPLNLAVSLSKALR